MEKIQFRITDVTLNDFGLECFKLSLMEKPLARLLIRGGTVIFSNIKIVAVIIGYKPVF